MDHRDTLTPPLDPTPGDGAPSAKLTEVTAAPKGTLTGVLSASIPPVSSGTVPKDTAVARLPGLVPAEHRVESKPDGLPPAVPTPVVNTVRALDNLSAGMPAPAPAAPTPPLVEAMRYFLDNRPGEAMLCLKGYDKENQELLLLLLPLAARLAEGKLTAGNAQDTMYFYDQLNRMLVDLRPRLNLVIDKVCFCRDIRGFGMYRPMPNDPPTYPRGDRMDIYVEVRNFSSTRQIGEGGRTVYVTRLRTSAEILTRDKRMKVWPAGNERFVFHRDGPDVCQALRHDYFDHCYFTLPQELPPGSYTLSIQVEDVSTKRVAREALDFIVR
ncbi:MAG TPA: hypothetical protein VFA18_10915 [Gemmataceae bacterium]|nr:hypothetical protein [Gemmataceae bacterium]